MADLDPRFSGRDELLNGVSDLERDDCDGLSLSDRNTIYAVSLGIRVGQQAIRQILTGGAGPLGDKRDRLHDE